MLSCHTWVLLFFYLNFEDVKDEMKIWIVSKVSVVVYICVKM